MYKCECEREFENKQSYCAHCRHCKVHLGHNPTYELSDEARKARGWNRGLKASSDPRLAKIVNTRKKNYLEGKFFTSLDR